MADTNEIPTGVSCSRCGYVFEMASGVGQSAGAKISDGAVSICIVCANIDIYTVDQAGAIGIRPTTDDERARIGQDPEITRIRAAIILLGVTHGR